jgi:hypothetical protein
MGGSRQTQTQNQHQTTNFANTSAYDWLTPPESSDVNAVRNFQFQHDPRISYSFARAAQRIGDTYRNPLGGATTPQIRDASQRAAYGDLATEEAQALREENYGLQGLDYARRVDVAGMTQPRLAQTSSSGTSSSSGSGTSNIQQSTSPLGSIISGGSGIAGALIL